MKPRTNFLICFAAIMALIVITTLPSRANERNLLYRGTGVAVTGDTDFISNYKPAQGVVALEVTIAVVGTNSKFRVDWDGQKFDLLSTTGDLVAGDVYTLTLGVQEGVTYGFDFETTTTAYYTITEVYAR